MMDAFTPLFAGMFLLGLSISAPAGAVGEEGAGRDDEKMQAQGFLYLREIEETPVKVDRKTSLGASGFTPRLSAIGGLDRSVDAGGRLRATGAFTPRYAGSEIAISFGSTPNAADSQSGFDVSLSSQVRVDHGLLSGSELESLIGPEDRRAYNLGLSVGYSGFRLGASVSRETGGLEADYEGVDVGVGYEWSNFATALSVGEYTRSPAAVSAFSTGVEDHFYKLELGAAYTLSERVRFSGGVRLFEYGPAYAAETDSDPHSGLLYLGTRLNF